MTPDSGTSLRRVRAPLGRLPAWLRRLGCAVTLVTVAPWAVAGQLALGDFLGIKRGMSESEVYYRVGAPDRIVVDGVDQGAGVVHEGNRRELHYIPGPEEHDPHLSIVHVRNGRVAALERIKLLTRAPAAAPTPAARGEPEVVDREHAIRAGRADRRLEAAERYSAVRARLKAENQDTTGPGGPATLYQGEGADGVRYYGDRPAAAADAPD